MEKRANPFTLSFGKKPVEYIARLEQTSEVTDTFQADPPSNQVYMITGVRGSGKTVFMSAVASSLAESDTWIVTELSTTMDMLGNLASKLYNTGMRLQFEKARIDVSFLGIGISIEGAEKLTDMETAVEKMLQVLQKQGKKLLITVDEIVNNEYVRIFSSIFQIFIRKNYPVYLLMTGLYENIYDLQNENNLTFLYRAPKIILKPLNAGAMINSYEKTFAISFEKAKEMAALTGGYPFAFQVLGYLVWEARKSDPDSSLMQVLPAFDQYLDEYVYSKIWSELSATDRKIVRAMADTKEENVTEIRSQLGMKPQEFSVYRKRLINKGVVFSPCRGEIRLALPRFGVFVRTQFDEWG